MFASQIHDELAAEVHTRIMNGIAKQVALVPRAWDHLVSSRDRGARYKMVAVRTEAHNSQTTSCQIHPTHTINLNATVPRRFYLI